MTGLEKMIAQIGEDVRQEAEQRLEAARAEASRIEAQAEAESEAAVSALLAESQTEAEHYLERVRSSADLKRRTLLLEAKQKVIREVLETAYSKLCGLEEEAYFELICRLLEKYAQRAQGEIGFSAADLARLPKGFEKKISEIAGKNGGSLTLREEPMNIESGFVLVYGGIEENCTFRALFDTQRDILQDLVHRELFS